MDVNVGGHFEKSTGERPIAIVAFGVEMKTIPVPFVSNGVFISKSAALSL
jgi:hypothetical protein